MNAPICANKKLHTNLGLESVEAAIHVPEVLRQGKPPVEALGPPHAPHHHERAHQALVLSSVLDRILPPRPPGLAKEAT